jgi:hypothetical protein
MRRTMIAALAERPVTVTTNRVRQKFAQIELAELLGRHLGFRYGVGRSLS